MSLTFDRERRPLSFPPSLQTDEAGMILPCPSDELAGFAEQVAPDQLLSFVRRLINVTRKRRRQIRWSAVNRQRMELARLCIERILAERIVEAGFN
ncbi:hypothetical protein [Sphingomonas abietis]|uniref:Uncharacterized protein n=1 Tax=Sphingomonas abietis TaxID=3012344 RepID=A0ABY7NSD7_9SPHN|nr:hypothetical protein [Sphingomonas abietis]WBO24476.1 hypothetical protein PBT88_10415 [Sphingomonas abietis]